MTPPNTHNVLAELVEKVHCKPGWYFRLEDEEGALRLVITVAGQDTYNPENRFRVSHWFPVPTATYNRASWQRWLFDHCLKVENHEMGEWFVIDGHRPFAPLHGPGEDPYTVHEYRNELDAQTLQDGSVSTEVRT